jgi:hypothetical protein
MHKQFAALFAVLTTFALSRVTDEVEGIVGPAYTVKTHFTTRVPDDANFSLNYEGKSIKCRIPNPTVKEKIVSGVVHTNIGIHLT